ncbi:MAG: queuosine precursor transporter [Planctomycetota bacterium]
MAGGEEAGRARAAAVGFSRAEATFSALAGLFMVTLVLTNVIGTKLFVLPLPEWLHGVAGGPAVTLTSGIITYPITFLLTDTVAEIWGLRRAQFMVWSGFAMSFVMLLVLQIAIHLPPSPIWMLESFGLDSAEATQNAFHATFSNPGTLLFASMTAYLVAQLFDVRLYHFWWRVTGGRHLWLRNNGSTWISQLVDTIIVNSIFLRFGLGMEWGPIVAIIAANYVVKVLLAIIDTPLIYAARIALERWLGIRHDASRGSAPLA